MKGRILVFVIVLALVIGCVAGGFYYLESYDKIYYAKVDNTVVKKLSETDELKYEYTLQCFDKDGKEKKLTFKTTKELREGAYISLEVRSMGVHKWEEVQLNDLPQKVQGKIK
ncbi:MAG: YxeA family protein [Faecalibacterium sp.]|nr:YxeA family protein [Ruminococcus sp.]MCM1392900.1 YxeA family protein [Ruminococcus sp.]MCM1485318.1 YxeA family protein [Faecalibacterium sp.]